MQNHKCHIAVAHMHSLIEGDPGSLAVVYNNLAGLNQMHGFNHQEYLRYMGDTFCGGIPIQNGDPMTLVLTGKVVARCRIGDESAERVTEQTIMKFTH